MKHNLHALLILHILQASKRLHIDVRKPDAAAERERHLLTSYRAFQGMLDCQFGTALGHLRFAIACASNSLTPSDLADMTRSEHFSLNMDPKQQHSRLKVRS